MALWRRDTIPACPNCKRPAANSVHATSNCDGDLYVDIETGIVRCQRCDSRFSVEEVTHNCTNCGCKYVGGEIWQGMRTDLARVGNQAWVRRIGITKGSAQVRIVKPGKPISLLIEERAEAISLLVAERAAWRPETLWDRAASISGCLGLWVFSLLCSLIGIVMLFQG